jgi:energy-coupling factor transporter ATP-binding protein EcfA2
MKYINHVKSSIKKGCDVQLSPRTVIVGPNGAGKTTIVQAIELATNGFVTDMEGREQVKLGKALSRLFSKGEPMFAEVTMADSAGPDASFSWTMEEGPKGGMKRPNHQPPFRVRFPVQELIATLKGDASTVGAWLEGQVLNTMTKEDLLSALPPAVREDADKFITRQRKTDFLALAKTAAQESKNLKSQATRSETTVGRMTEGIAPPLTANKLAEIEAEWAALTQQTGGVSQAAYDEKKGAVTAMSAELAALEAKLSALVPIDAKVGTALARVGQAKQLIRMHVDHFGIDSCWVCGNGEADAILGQVDQLNAVQGEFLPQVEAETLRHQAEALRASTKVNLNFKLQELEGMTVSDTHPEVEARALMQRISDDRAARQAWSNADAARKEISALRAQADRLSLVGKELKTAGQALLNKQKAAFETNVSSFLPEGEVLGVDLASSRLGLMRDEQLHSALSGAEESRVLLALASAQEDGSTPCVLIPKDRGWDRDTLGHVMTALAASPVQVVIMSTVQPDPVEGWTMVNLE